MSSQFQSLFLGVPLSSSLKGQIHANSLYLGRGPLSRRTFRKCMCTKKHNEWITQAIRFSNFCGKYVVFLRNAIGSRSELKVKCVKEPFSQSRALVRSLSPLWKEGLLLVRGSVFVAVISGVCLLVWYGQNKAKGYIESKLLPSICSALSDYIQREIDFGKVRRVSPLSITLESCSIGPHGEEFSCGEVPTMKLRLCPFASLRRGKIVIDAVLSHPSVVVVQKKDYTWLGIPASEGSLQRHLSTEEGIDYRTKTRRVAREELAACWERQRDNDAKEAAERGYIIPERDSSLSEDEVWQEDAIQLTNLTNYKSFSCMDEKMHWRDHHCMDTGPAYNMKHADLEKAFGVKFPGSGLKFWSSVIKGPKKLKFKRRSNGCDNSAAGINAKRRILERSASRAIAYFRGLANEEFDEPSQSSDGYDIMSLDTLLVQIQRDNNADVSVDVSSVEERLPADNQHGEPDENLGIQPLTRSKHLLSRTYGFSLIRDPFLKTLDILTEAAKVGENFPSSTNVVRDAKINGVNGEYLSVDVVNRDMDAHTSEINNYTSGKPHSEPAMVYPVSSSALTLNSGLSSFSRNIRRSFSYFLAGPIQKLKSGLGPKVEDIVAELVDGVDVVPSEGIEKMLPVSLDSVHFKGGTLMLLAYGDREPR